MNGLVIKWLQDDHDCETCGWSSAEGAEVTLDNIIILNLEPQASCFGGQSWDRADVFELIIKQLGFTISEV